MNSPDYLQGLRDAADLVESNSWNDASDMRNAKDLGAGLARMLRNRVDSLTPVPTVNVIELESQQYHCLEGQHEKERPENNWCRHCRCLYVERQ